MAVSFRRLITSSVAALASMVALHASATPTFPASIQTDLNLFYTPDCTVCHATDLGGTGTVVQPFGVAMRARGLQPLNEASLKAALAKMATDKVDSVGDGVADIDRLKEGKDPNNGKVIATPPAGAGDGGATPASGEIPPYHSGCGRIAPSAAPGAADRGLAWVGALGLGAVVARRRRRA